MLSNYGLSNDLIVKALAWNLMNKIRYYENEMIRIEESCNSGWFKTDPKNDHCYRIYKNIVKDLYNQQSTLDDLLNAVNNINHSIHINESDYQIVLGYMAAMNKLE